MIKIASLSNFFQAPPTVSPLNLKVFFFTSWTPVSSFISRCLILARAFVRMSTFCSLPRTCSTLIKPFPLHSLMKWYRVYILASTMKHRVSRESYTWLVIDPYHHFFTRNTHNLRKQILEPNHMSRRFSSCHELGFTWK